MRQINYNPPERWMRRLKVGHIVWLIKEELWASVACNWIPPEPGSRAGEIAIRRVINNYLQPPECWYINIEGKGLNGGLLMLPAEGHLEDDEVPLNDLHKIYDCLDKLEEKILSLSWRYA